MIKKLLLTLLFFIVLVAPVQAVTATGCVDKSGKIYENGAVVETTNTSSTINSEFVECRINTTNGVASWIISNATAPRGVGSTYEQFYAGFSATANNVLRQTPLGYMYTTAKCELEGSVNNAQCYTYFSLISLVNAGTQAIAGNMMLDQGNTSGGAIGSTTSLISAIYKNPAASIGDYVQMVANNAGFPNAVKPVYAAQGFGFTGLSPVRDLWVAMRNIAYVLFSLLFIVIGLMIIMRVKVDPKTVISVQSALPKIFFSLLLITFSYPIAGFMIDVMYLVIGLLISVVQLTGLYPSLPDFVKNLKSGNFIELLGNLAYVANTNNEGGAGLSGLVYTTLTGLLGKVGVTDQEVLGKGVVTNLITPLVGLYLSISIWWALIRVFLNLISSYGTIMFSIIMAPLVLLGEAIPGRNTAAEWAKGIFANLMVFPLTIGMILIGNIILEYFKNINAPASSVFIPPLIGVGVSTIGAVLGYVVIMTLPHAQDLVNEWLSVKVSKSTTYWQESLPFKGAAQKGIGNVAGALTRLIPI